jgi:glycerol-3-phosphate dehydrogenase subunit B
VPSADVVVVGAGLAGLMTGHELARRGARVIVLAKGLASTHWTAGSIDVAAPPGARTPRDGLAALRAVAGHPYAVLGDDVEPAVTDFLALTRAAGLDHAGDLDSEIRPAPTGIGGTRPVAIVPAAQAAAIEPWQAGETLVVCGIEGFKDFWPRAVAGSLARPEIWSPPGATPNRVVAVSARLPDAAARHNLTALHLARAFDDPAWRPAAIDAIVSAIDGARVGQPARAGVPAVLGLRDHAAIHRELERRLGIPVFELPLVPPSVPGLRLYDALRRALLASGVRIQIGESVSRVERNGNRIELVATPAAAREYAMRAGAVVLATGGLIGGGLVGRADGGIDEVVASLPVEAADREAWFSADPFDPRGHAVEAAGIRTDDALRPVDGRGRAVYANVRICGALVAGQRWLRDRSGDGVALASARRAAETLSRDGFAPGPPLPATADTTGSGVAARSWGADR